MTDLEKFIELFNKVGIEFEMKDGLHKYEYKELAVWSPLLDDYEQEEHEDNPLGEYISYFFHLDGSFWHQGITEMKED